MRFGSGVLHPMSGVYSNSPDFLNPDKYKVIAAPACPNAQASHADYKVIRTSIFPKALTAPNDIPHGLCDSEAH
jgi:hypothetical protein